MNTSIQALEAEHIHLREEAQLRYNELIKALVAVDKMGQDDPGSRRLEATAQYARNAYHKATRKKRVAWDAYAIRRYGDIGRSYL